MSNENRYRTEYERYRSHTEWTGKDFQVVQSLPEQEIGKRQGHDQYESHDRPKGHKPL